MQTLPRPDIKVYCPCGYADEAWRFHARSTGKDEDDDDVDYICPKCKKVASLTPPENAESTPPEAKKETPEMANNKRYVVADLEKHELSILPEDRVKTVGDDVDLLIPMISPALLETLPKRTRREFENDFRQLCSALDTGELPYNPLLDQWLKEYGVEMFNSSTLDDEANEVGEVDDAEMAESDADTKEFEGAVLPDTYIAGFEAGFSAGFSTGVTHVIQQLPPSQDAPETAAETTTERAPIKHPLTSVAKQRAKTLLRLVREKKNKS